MYMKFLIFAIINYIVYVFFVVNILFILVSFQWQPLLKIGSKIKRTDRFWKKISRQPYYCKFLPLKVKSKEIFFLCFFQVPRLLSYELCKSFASIFLSIRGNLELLGLVLRLLWLGQICKAYLDLYKRFKANVLSI